MIRQRFYHHNIAEKKRYANLVSGNLRNFYENIPRWHDGSYYKRGCHCLHLYIQVSQDLQIGCRHTVPRFFHSNPLTRLLGTERHTIVV